MLSCALLAAAKSNKSIRLTMTTVATTTMRCEEAKPTAYQRLVLASKLLEDATDIVY